ncbi:MAG: enolase C-terminal domain-like protein [Chloroflexota bacterium]
MSMAREAAADACVVEGGVHLRVPLRRPLRTAAGVVEAHYAWLGRLRAPDGRTGTGEAALGPGADAAAAAALAAAIRAAVGGGVAALPAEAADAPASRAFRAAIDGALLDLGRLPALAERRPGVVCNALLAGETPAALAAEARAAVAAGYRTLKLKAGPDVAEALAAVRAAVGEAIALRVDANGAWAPADARAILAALAPYRPEYVEQPIADAPAAELAAFRAAAAVPVALDESVRCPASAHALLAAGAADALVVKPARVGGPAAALAIAAAAAAAGVPVTISTLLETGVGLAAAGAVAAALPGDPDRAHGLATADLLVDDCVVALPVIVAGRMDVPPGPGLGIVPDREAVRANATEVVGRWR